MRFLVGGFRIFLLVMITAVFYGFYLISLLFWKHTDKRGFRLRRFYLRTINPLLGFQVETALSWSDQPALYVSNHRGLLDFFVILRYLDAFVVSKAEVAQIPLLAQGARYTGVIFVSREDKSSRMATRQSIVENIRKGRNILLFPEGTTFFGPKSGPFRRGAFEEMARHGFPVVPIAIEYKTSRDFWVNDKELGMFFRQFGKRRTACRLHFGPAIANNDADILMHEVKDWIDGALLSMRSGWSEIDFPEVKQQE